MILTLHIVIAMGSIFYTGFVFFRPSRIGLKISYYLIGGTVATGTILILNNLANMVTACVTGLLYLGIVFVGIVFANRRLAGKEIAEQ